MSESTYNSPTATQTMPTLPGNAPNIPEMTDLVKSIGKTAESKLSSGELGILWSTYQTRTLFHHMLGKFTQQTTDPKAKKLMNDYLARSPELIEDIKQIFEKEHAVVPQGFSEKDVFADAPRLFDDEFHVMLLRMLAKTTIGFNGVNMSMSYRADVRAFYEKALKFSVDVYNETTDYLTDQGILPRTPYVTMPKGVTFIDEAKYMSGIQLFGNKRAINTIEMAYIHSIIKENSLGIQLMAGFAQTAKESDIKEYFNRGKELAKKIVSDMSEILIQSDIHFPGPWAGKATDSTAPLFSDKLMMYMINILTSFSLSGSSLGMAFSMRGDLPAKLGKILSDTLAFAQDGGWLMIKHRWMEEPPQMEDRNAIIRSTQ